MATTKKMSQSKPASISKTASLPSTTVNKPQPLVTTTRSSSTTSEKAKPSKSAKTRVVAHIDCGFTNNLFIRGEGVSTLSWDKGTQMKNISPNEWVWESDRPFSTMQFKVLVNDNWYEQGNNHSAAFGQEVDFDPQF